MLLIVSLFKTIFLMVENFGEVITLYTELQEFISLTGNVGLLV